MDTYTSTPISSVCEEEAGIIIIRYEPREKKQGRTMRYIRPLLKWFGLLSTVALGAVALAPEPFNVPVHLRPWVFVTFVPWFFAFCAGLFNL